ncbi:MAG TPA: hypothetical protein VHW23_02480 [Kofleriaceae bacterium]|jgi:hypothetical protein|nr:hypothetical protein [Kofleriaceae bacterium]
MMVGLSAAGCGGSDSLAPSEACNEVAAGLCNRFYACYSAAEISAAGLPATESDCTTMFEASFSCSTQTTTNTCSTGTYHGDQASVCADQIHGLDCPTVRDPNFDQVTAAPACGKVCT